MKNTVTKRQIKSVETRPVGRQWFDGKDEKEVLAKLEQVFAIDGTVKEACSYADISYDSFYRYLKQHEELRNRIDQLRERPILKARQTIVKDLETPSGAQWYLERKRKKEFGNAPVTPGINVSLQIVGMKIEKENKEIKSNVDDGTHIQNEEREAVEGGRALVGQRD